MYMVREVYTAQRGRAPEIVAGFKILDEWFEQAGYTNRRIYVDYTGAMDTCVYQVELDSLDDYLRDERAHFVDPDEETKSLIDHFNSNAVAGHREIFEVIQ
jgi:hypothetical protein